MLPLSRSSSLCAVLLVVVGVAGCFIQGRSIVGANEEDGSNGDAGAPCGDGGRQCGAACLDLRTDPANCGACGRACPPRANARPSCMAGVCVTQCDEGFADCDGDSTNGCEKAVAADLANCGACGRRCEPVDGSAQMCRAGRCVAACPEGRDDCDGNVMNGCETDVTTDPSHCGRCGAICPSGPNQQATCMAGQCGRACRMGYSDCNREARDGCERLGLCL